MVPRHARLSARADHNGAAVRPNTRRSQRTPVYRSVEITANGCDAATATLADISVYGCSLGHRSEWLRIGRFITIKVDRDRSFQAIVRWNRNGQSGIEFLRPLLEAQIADLTDPDDA
jgi:PilZ domain